MNFRDFFKAAAGHDRGPFEYQERLASGGAGCESRLISIPTGLGKTAAVILAWLWNRVALSRPDWPRRMVYCLPMRTLVEQTEGEVKKWLVNLLGKADELGLSLESKQELKWLVEHCPVVLMGGEEPDAGKAEWDLYPEKPCILIGTQDMLLSRALNRGYGMSRYRWPMHFGLLNTDALWVMDETQLMGVGVETSAQLDGFRNSPTAKNTFTWWMSATIDKAQLATVDHPGPAEAWPCLKLSAADLAMPTLRTRMEANKPLARIPITLESASKSDYAKTLANFIAEKHRSGTLTLVVLNRVLRAQQVYGQMLKAGIPGSDLALIHSRYRQGDRRKHEDLLRKEGNRIVVATQAIEAGIDISACTLITELAPWASLVQRFGRCNRRGEFTSQAQVFWIDVKAKDDQDELALPYRSAELDASRQTMTNLQEVSPRRLEQISVPAEPVIRPVVRRKDLLDLFDTTSDLCGNDLDVSRYIRDGEDSDVQVFWRDLKGEEPAAEQAQPARDELCRVAVGQFRRFLGLKSKPAAYVWNPLDEAWQRTTRIRAGAVYLSDTETGGYSVELGWTGDPGDRPTALAAVSGDNDGFGRNEQTFIGKWVTLETHTSDVMREIAGITTALGLDRDLAKALGTSALWHDIGKAHPVFHEALMNGGPAPRPDTLWAKSERLGGRPKRLGFRHELASALAWLAAGPENEPNRDLVAYLIAAHHGKVRLSIRSLPDEARPGNNPGCLFARGVWDGDELPPMSLNGHQFERIKLNLAVMRMGDSEGGPSWLTRMMALRDEIGPARLAFLEALLRAADARASRAEAT